MEIKTSTLIEAVQLETGYNKRSTRLIINSFLKLFAYALRRGITVDIRSLGSFSIERDLTINNAAYGQYKLIFKPSRSFNAKINRK